MKLLNKKNMTVLTVLGGVMLPSMSWACACGCGVFDVGGLSMLPSGEGGMAYVQYDWQNQNHNWSGSSQASSDHNGDLDIKTDFIMVGAQYMFSQSWGAELEIPDDYRSFTTRNPFNVPTTLKWNSLGDIRVHGLYTGFSADMSSGIDFGLKFPTGDFTHNDQYGDIDRDSEIGTGSTDVLLGGYHRGAIASSANWNWFVQGEFDLPVLTQDQYRPGWEFDSDSGIEYDGFSLGRVHISPMAQAIFSYRGSDSGRNASGGSNDPDYYGNPDQADSGYERVLLSPGLAIHIHPVEIYGDVEVPVWQHFTGNQLAAAILFKINVSYHF